jgi:hypothetical protein
VDPPRPAIALETMTFRMRSQAVGVLMGMEEVACAC